MSKTKKVTVGIWWTDNNGSVLQTKNGQARFDWDEEAVLREEIDLLHAKGINTKRI